MVPACRLTILIYMFWGVSFGECSGATPGSVGLCDVMLGEPYMVLGFEPWVTATAAAS